MRLGVHLPVAGKDASPSIILQVAAEAERIGLDSVWSWERLMPPTVPIALGGAGGPVMDAPEAFGIVYDPIELPTLPPKPAGSASSTSTGTLRTAPQPAPATGTAASRLIDHAAPRRRCTSADLEPIEATAASKCRVATALALHRHAGKPLDRWPNARRAETEGGALEGPSAGPADCPDHRR
jgi:hypothetical protein